jgi:3-dehydro-L-gulonate 2-dehydrogenase
MSQFSYGKTELYAHRNQALPVPGGFDRAGNLTQDPAAILESGRPLPIGYWKGSGLSLLLDLTATLLSGGLSTYQIGQQSQETGVSQVYIAFDVSRAATPNVIEHVVDETLAFVKTASPTADGEDVLFPGERVLKTRRENRENGIPVDKAIWEQILAL